MCSNDDIKQLALIQDQQKLEYVKIKSVLMYLNTLI